MRSHGARVTFWSLPLHHTLPDLLEYLLPFDPFKQLTDNTLAQLPVRYSNSNYSQLTPTTVFLDPLLDISTPTITNSPYIDST
jgi:hypothetical protein